MKISWILVCLLALGACKSGSTAPAEGEAQEEAEPAAPVQEAIPSAEPVAEAEPPPTDPDTPAPAEVAAPAVEPDPNAPPDVAAPPKGAKRTESGLAWKVLKRGKGKSRPGKFDTVKINYTGWTPDGRTFDNSRAHGQVLTVTLNRTIFGFSEGVRLMVAGEKRRLWIPAKLAYGEEGSAEQTAPTQPLGDLVFDVELVSFEKANEPPSAPKDVGQIPADATRSESGLAWRVLENGTGSDRPIETSVVELVYTVWTADGAVSESSVLRGGVDTVGIKRLVPGWTEGMKLMVEGERRLFWIPEDLAYQGQPHRPAGMLVVDVTLVQIRRDLHQVR